MCNWYNKILNSKVYTGFQNITKRGKCEGKFILFCGYLRNSATFNFSYILFYFIPIQMINGTKANSLTGPYLQVVSKQGTFQI